jgi:hypothetical protein
MGVFRRMGLSKVWSRLNEKCTFGFVVIRHSRIGCRIWLLGSITLRQSPPAPSLTYPCVPNGASVASSEHLQDLLDGLEFFIPEVLRDIHHDWDYESLDGVIPVVVRKVGEREAELFGLCIIISDQTLTPIHLRLQPSASSDEVSWLECQLGEKGEQGMIRTPYELLDRAIKPLYALEGKEDMIDWLYKVTCGQKTP